MSATLYHKEIFMPAAVRELPKRTFFPRITQHAVKASQNDRYGRFNIPKDITFDGSQVVEAEMEGAEIVKLVVREPFDNEVDLVWALGFNGNDCFVKTVWLNMANDKHSTLNSSRYAKK